jgi:hypothetical protein
MLQLFGVEVRNVTLPVGPAVYHSLPLYICGHLGNLYHNALRRDLSPVLASGDIGKIDGNLSGSAHKFRSTSTDRNETRDGCPHACGLPSMRAATRLILRSSIANYKRNLQASRQIFQILS